jgi:hypothetical protein
MGKGSNVVDPDPDPDWIRIQWRLWILIHNRNPDPESRGKKWKKYFLFIFIIKTDDIQTILLLLTFEQNCLKFCCGSGSGSALDPDWMTLWIRILIRIDLYLDPYPDPIEINQDPRPWKEEIVSLKHTSRYGSTVLYWFGSDSVTLAER